MSWSTAVEDAPRRVPLVAAELRRLARLAWSELLSSGWPAAGEIVALSLLPGAALGTLAAAATGIENGSQWRKVLDGMLLGRAVLPLAAGCLSKAAAFVGGLALLADLEARSHGVRLSAAQAYERAFALAVPVTSAAALAFERALGGLCLGIGLGPASVGLYLLAPWSVLLDGREGREALARSAELVGARPVLTLGSVAAAAAFWALTALCATYATGAFGWLFWKLSPDAHALLGWQLSAFLRKLAIGWTAAAPAAFLIVVYREAAALRPPRC